MKKFDVSIGQKEQITRWWMPSLLSSLERKHGLSVLYIKKSLVVDRRKSWFYVDQKICFPLFVGGLSIGCVVSLSEISSLRKVREVRYSIDSYLCQIHSGVFPNQSLAQKKLKKSVSFYSKSFIFIQGKTEKEIVQKSHGLYLKTDNFAFLVMNEKELLEIASLENMDGVFICIPSFYNLSGSQKRILKEELKKPLSCFISLGWIGDHAFPLEWKSFLMKSISVPKSLIPPV